MLHRLLYILIALLTFSIGAAMSDTYQTFVKHGFSPIRRILRIESPLAAKVASELSVDADMEITEREYTPGIVVIHFKTDVDGRVNRASAMSGDPTFYQQSIEAAYQMRFSRRRYRGYRVGTAGLVVYGFTGERRMLLEVHKGPAVELICGSD